MQNAGSFSVAQWLTTFADGLAAHMAATDLNGDGHLAVATYFEHFDERAVPTIRLLTQNTSDGWFSAIDTAIPVTTVQGRDGPAVADLNGNRRPDFAFVGMYLDCTPADGVSIILSDLNLLLQSADGRFVSTTVLALPMQATRVGAGDGDCDGPIGLVV